MFLSAISLTNRSSAARMKPKWPWQTC